MLGATLQIARGHGDDRFYNPARARWSYYQHHQDVIRSRSCGSAAFSSITSLVSVGKAEFPECLESGEGASNSESCTSSPEASVCSSLESESVQCSNLDRFLESTTPSVPVQYVAKRTMRGRRICDVEYMPYFALGDLWDSFKEWSAYGAGVPLVLNGSDSVVQYYVPYLSGIQLYNQPCERSVIFSKLGEDISCNSVGITDYKSDKLLNLKGCNQKAFMFHRNGFSFRCNGITMTNGFSSDSSEVWNPEGTVLFEFLEQDSPYTREPLANKVSDLFANFPGLKALRSCDLSPSSWFSVAWYPIYRIPTGPTLKDLDACFLTFHSLSTPAKDVGISSPAAACPKAGNGVPKETLPVFGLASYKLKDSVWTSDLGRESQIISSLHQAADNWLQLLGVHLPDYQFFSSHSSFHG